MVFLLFVDKILTTLMMMLNIHFFSSADHLIFLDNILTTLLTTFNVCWQRS